MVRINCVRSMKRERYRWEISSVKKEKNKNREYEVGFRDIQDVISGGSKPEVSCLGTVRERVC